jgi:hypothetical protein
MTRRICTLLLLPVLLACGLLASPATAQTLVLAQEGGRRGGGHGVERPAPEPPIVEPAPRTGNRALLRLWRPQERRGKFQEPAFARGYDDGYMRGRDDSKDHDRYDPVGDRDYRRGDLGYERDYGSRDAYKNNYRAGFRQGYDEGYKDATRGKRPADHDD